MALSINSNQSAINVRRNLNATTRELSTSLERLSSGLRINRAADDAAGLSVREGLRAESSGLQASVRNAEQATNLIQTAEASLNEVNAILVRMRELAVQSSSGTVSDSNRESVQTEFSQLSNEIDRIAQSTTFNSQVLLTGFGNAVSSLSSVLVSSNVTGVTNVAISGAASGTFTFIDAADDSDLTLGNGSVTQTISLGTALDGNVVATGTKIVANFDRLGIQVTLAGVGAADATGSFSDGDLDTYQLVVEEGTGASFQIGPSDSSFNRLELSIPDLTATGDELNLESTSVTTQTTAQSAITDIDGAITRVSQERGNLGAIQNRLTFNLSATENRIEQVQAAESTISDTDIAQEVSKLTRAQVLSQGASALLVQAQSVQATSVLTLLGFQQQ
ncbi:MAG: flagellin [Candidatus Latescibacterota bacterium]|nr:flagellin [Candidatus Latescibacterota bacterium]